MFRGKRAPVTVPTVSQELEMAHRASEEDAEELKLNSYLKYGELGSYLDEDEFELFEFESDQKVRFGDNYDDGL